MIDTSEQSTLIKESTRKSFLTEKRRGETDVQNNIKSWIAQIISFIRLSGLINRQARFHVSHYL